ncbi:MAG: UvrD-helicase domain-containing protein [Spirochaetes bacterium]|nr:UvrD-helicase domain-containing protein [Spirochaetota bacterium]
MKFIADFHIHSHYSIATSRELVPERIELWARLKGIDVVGTGDCVHPGWGEELEEKLEPAGNGLFRLRDDFRLDETRRLSGGNRPGEVYFILTGELSSIYKKGGKTRKVHNLCVFPDFESLGKVRERLDRAGNIRSDGRPILGIDSKVILDMVLESSEHSFLVPCHIWTPWFSVLGSKSGFDSLEECYEDLTRHIFAVETGLSSDPPMNRVCSFLDPFTLISNSDAHSPERLGREANVFETELSYDGIYRALKDSRGFSGTIEFFPQEGKYHYDGHRSCGVRWDPLETLRAGGRCTVCGREVTKGVMYRVAELADRSEAPDTGTTFRSITPLPELISEISGGKGRGTKTVSGEYRRLAGGIGSEFYLLLDAPLDHIRKEGGELLAEGVRRLRSGNVSVDEGYDGEFGRVRVFGPRGAVLPTDGNLFETGTPVEPRGGRSSLDFDLRQFRELRRRSNRVRPRAVEEGSRSGTALPAREPTAAQKRAIDHGEGPCMVMAGPGTGKTAVLAERVAALGERHGAAPREILALTFSNRASEEMRSRIGRLLPRGGTTVSTFHSFGLEVLRERHADLGRGQDFIIIDEDDVVGIITALAGDRKGAAAHLRAIHQYKEGRSDASGAVDIIEQYDSSLRKMNAFDLDDLVFLPVRLFETEGDILEVYRKKFRWILVDEFQDINAIQYRFLKLLAGPGRPNLFVIGDPDQAIYGFRGSDAGYIERFREDYPSTKVIVLDRSFRCPKTIMRAGAGIIGRGIPIEGRDLEIKVRIQEHTTGRSEADWIASTIEKSMGGVRSFSRDSGISDGDQVERSAGFADYAVLCRASFLFPDLIEAFGNHGVPLQVVGSESAFRQPPLRDVIASLRGMYTDGTSPSLSNEVAGDVRAMIDKGDAVADVLSFIMIILETPGPEARRLKAWASSFGDDYRRFFRAVALRRGEDDSDVRAEAVSLMTIHAAKGLEFDTVFIPACEKGIIPFDLFGLQTGEEFMEEVRLFYVGVTRTKRNLFLSHAGSRNVRGRTVKCERSPLIDRLSEDILEAGKRTGRRRKERPDGVQLDLFKGGGS